MPRRWRRSILKITLAIVITSVVLWSIIPVLYVVTISLSPLGEFPRKLLQLPTHATLYYYKRVLIGLESIIPFMINSLLIATVTTLGTLVLSITAAHSLSRGKASENRLAFYFILVLLMIPPIALILPFFIIIKDLKLLDTIYGISLAHITWNTPFATWLMKGYFDTIPIEVEEAAIVDGASLFGTVVKITLPMSAPGLVVTGAFVFLFSYIEYLYALTLSRYSSVTLAVQVASHVTAVNIYYQQVAASVLISAIPLIVLYGLLQGRIVEGLTMGALKG